MSAGRSLAVLAVFFSAEAMAGAEAPLPEGARLRLGPIREAKPSVNVSINSAAWSPNGATIVTAATDQSIRLWDAALGSELRTVLVPRHLWCAASDATFAPDGKALIAHGVRVDLVSGKEPTAFGYSGPFAASPDGHVLAVAAGRGKVHLWDATTTKFLGQLAAEGGATSGPLAFSPDGRILALGQAGAASVELWDVAEHKLLAAFRPAQVPPSFFAFTPDGGSLVVVPRFADAPVEVWDVTTARLVRRLHRVVDEDLHGQARAAALSPDGQLLALAYIGGTVRVYELRSEQVVYRFRGHEGHIRALAFSPNGKELLSAGDDGMALVWRVAPDLSRTGRLSPDEASRLWEDLGRDALRARQAQFRLAAAPDIAMLSLRERLRAEAVVDAARAARLVAQLDDDKFVVREAAMVELQRLGDAARADLEKALQGTASPELRRRAQSLLDALDTDTPDRLRDYRAIQVLGWLKTPQADTLLRALAAGAPGAHGTQTAATVLKVRERPPPGPPPAGPLRVPTRMMYAHLDEVSGVAFSPDGKLLVSTGRDGAVRRWSIADRKELAVIRAHFGGAHALAFTPDGRLLTAGEDKMVRSWNVGSGKEVAVFKGHERPVFSLSVSRDGKWAVSGGAGGAVWLWDLAKGEAVTHWAEDATHLSGLAFTADGKLLAAGIYCNETGYHAGGGAYPDHQSRHLFARTLPAGAKAAAPDCQGNMLATAQDGKRVAVGSMYEGVGPAAPGETIFWRRDGSATVLDAATGRVVFQAESCGELVALSPDGRLLATAGGSDFYVDRKTRPFAWAHADAAMLRVWDVATGQVLLEHPGLVPTCLAFSLDGRRLAAGMANGGVHLWEDIPQPAGRGGGK
jgi:WD40 repeat protein